MKIKKYLRLSRQLGLDNKSILRLYKFIKNEFIVPTFHNLYMKFTLDIDRYLKGKYLDLINVRLSWEVSWIYYTL